MHYTIGILVVGLLGTLSGCVGLPAGVWSPMISQESKQFRVEKLDPMARIGVVSLLPDELQLRYDGLTVFQNRKHKDKVPHWKINRQLSNLVRTNLASRTMHRVGVMDNLGLMDPVTGLVKMYWLFERAEKHQFDIVISIRPYVPHSQHFWDVGYGLWGSSDLRSVQKHCAYSWAVLEVWDVDTKDKIGYKHSRTCNRDETIKVRDRLADYSLAEQAAIERIVKTSLVMSVSSALYGLGLH